MSLTMSTISQAMPPLKKNKGGSCKSMSSLKRVKLMFSCCWLLVS